MAWVYIPKGNTKYKDASGEKIWFEKPYFDAAFRRQFNTAEEKARFMNENRFVSMGDSEAKAIKEHNEMILREFDDHKEKHPEWDKVKKGE